MAAQRRSRRLAGVLPQRDLEQLCQRGTYAREGEKGKFPSTLLAIARKHRCSWDVYLELSEGRRGNTLAAAA